MDKIPKSYRVQKSCSNCRSVFIYAEQDEDTLAYCGFGNSKRPLSNSGFIFSSERFSNYLTEILGLSYDDDTFDLEYEELMHKWEEWCEGREVELCGICDEYKENEKKIP